MNKQKIENQIRTVFERAKKTDEAEFYACLMKHANLSPWDDRNTLKNFSELIEFFFEAILSKKYRAEDTLRIFLLLYCHFFEWSEMYNLFYDLYKVTEGERAGNCIEIDDSKTEEYWEDLKSVVQKELTKEKLLNAKSIIDKMSTGQIGINKKIKIIKDCNEPIGTILGNLFDNKLRNGFSHNNYSFSNEGLVIFDEVEDKTIVYSFDKLNMILNDTKTFSAMLIYIWQEYLSELKNRKLKGKYCEYEIEYTKDKKFRIKFINGSLPLGIYSYKKT